MRFYLQTDRRASFALTHSSTTARAGEPGPSVCMARGGRVEAFPQVE